MKKKLLFIITTLLLSIFLYSCTYDLHLIDHKIFMLTNYGNVDDGEFNENIWTGVKKFGQSRDVFYYYVPEEQNTDEPMDSIAYAVSQKATVIVAPGYQYQNIIFKAQEIYKDIYFLLIDAEPINDEGEIVYGNKTTSILFAEEESGFLAGYMSVVSGFENLGFIGGFPSNAVKKFGIGFVYGAYYAYYLQPLKNNTAQSITLNQPWIKQFVYLNSFEKANAHYDLALEMFTSVDLIFTAAGSANYSVFDAAIAASVNLNIDEAKRVIGSDINQGPYHNLVISSALKRMDIAVNQVLVDIFRNKFSSGLNLKTIIDDGVGLPIDEYFKFGSNYRNEYTKIFNLLKNSKVEIPQTKEELELLIEKLNIEVDIKDLLLLI